MVIISHFFGNYLNVQIMWTSIDLLFCLSGFLISGILIETKNELKYFQKFYIRRILRIFPLYYLLILLFSIFVYCLTPHPEYYYYFKNNIFYFLTYTQNWYFIHSGEPAGGHLNHTWSLAIDEQIYLLWPLLIWLCKKQKHLIYLCLFTILFSFIFRLCYNYYLISSPSLHSYPYFHNTFCRVDSFASGSLLYCFIKLKNKYLSNLKIFLVFIISFVLFAACAFGDNSFTHTGFYMRNFGITLAGIHFSTWIYFAINEEFLLLNYLLSNSFIRYIGKISYSLYIFHLFILLLFVSKINIVLSKQTNFSEIIAIIMCLCLSFIISILSYELFEKPIFKLKKKFNYSEKII